MKTVFLIASVALSTIAGHHHGGGGLRGANDGSFSPATFDSVRSVMPQAKSDKINENLSRMNDAMKQYGINTPTRQAAFLSQVSAETGQLNSMTEIGSGKKYEGRKDLGNTKPGDGDKYKGRGALQLTGKANYAAAGKALGVDLVNNPSLAATPEYSFKTAGWYWDSKNLNQVADKKDINKITKAVNGCTNCKTTHSNLRAGAFNHAIGGGGHDGVHQMSDGSNDYHGARASGWDVGFDTSGPSSSSGHSGSAGHSYSSPGLY
jgi:predicted chitinase